MHFEGRVIRTRMEPYLGFEVYRIYDDGAVYFRAIDRLNRHHDYPTLSDLKHGVQERTREKKHEAQKVQYNAWLKARKNR